MRDEHGYDGGWTLVKDAVRAWRQPHQEVFLPLSHPPGEAQVDFGFADVWPEGGWNTGPSTLPWTTGHSGQLQNP